MTDLDGGFGAAATGGRGSSLLCTGETSADVGPVDAESIVLPEAAEEATVEFVNGAARYGFVVSAAKAGTGGIYGNEGDA